jgi:FG-GAP repeat
MTHGDARSTRPLDIRGLIIRQRAELTDSIQKIGDETGEAVAIDGDTVVAGAPNATSIGVAHVFVKPRSGWRNMTQTAILTPSDGFPGDDFGAAVAVSGSTIFVSSQYLHTVYVFEKPVSGWANMTETAKLTASVPTIRFGLGLAVSDTTVVVGAYGTQQDGTAYLYVKPQGGWRDMQQTAELLASAKGDFGLAVAISGNTVAVGAPTAVSQFGVVYVYQKPDGGWADTAPIATLTASDPTQEENFGGAISMTGDTILVGAAFGGTARTGEAYIFTKPSGGWEDGTETARLRVTRGAGLFGSSVAIVKNTALVSSPTSLSTRGVVFAFQRPATGWATTSDFTSILVSSDGMATDEFGCSLAAGGVNVVVGACERDVVRGAAYLFGP